MPEPANLAGWLAAGALASERLWKLYTEHRTAKSLATTASITIADSLFKRATEMMDRLDADNDALRAELQRKDKEIITLRRRVEHLESQVDLVQGSLQDQEEALRRMEERDKDRDARKKTP